MAITIGSALRRALALMLSFCLAGTPAFAFAWGAVGHRVVGLVADQSLDPAARNAVRRIMGSSSLGDVATWMDDMRPTAEGQRMKNWHFQSVDLCKPGDAPCANDNCAQKRIESAIQTLKSNAGTSKSDRQARRKALSVLVHVVGDIHQPLHAAENNDFGGNLVTLKNRKCVDFETGKPVDCKLHAYWDNILVKSAMGKLSEKQFALQLARTNVSGELDVDAWIRESNALAKSKVHTYDGFTCLIGKNSVSLPAGYDRTAVPLVKEQLAKAGLRLAALLNDIYK